MVAPRTEGTRPIIPSLVSARVGFRELWKGSSANWSLNSVKLGEIQYKNIFIDGTKIEAYANKYTFVWKKTTLKNEQRMQEKARASLAELNN